MRSLADHWSRVRTRLRIGDRQLVFGLTIAIGGACGLAAVAFHLSIQAIEGAVLERALGASLAWWVIVPALGGLAAGTLLLWFPGARGSGIPQVKAAYASPLHRLRIRDAVAKFGIGSLQLGTGSSLGREGPTVQICAGLAKLMGRVAGMPADRLRLLFPVGAAAGVAAAFNAPIAAVTFTIEEIVGTLDQTVLSGVVVAAALAAVVEHSILGGHPVFETPPGFALDHASSLIVYAALGVAAAFVSVAFTSSLLSMRLRFRRTRLPMWAMPAIGAGATGVIAIAVWLVTREGGIFGGGYGTIESALSGRLALGVVLVLSGAKVLATVLSYSSGGAGGVFAPTLFIGATLGAAFGDLDHWMFGHASAEAGAFALVGMGAVFAATIRAPITSVLIIIEMTGGYGLTLPLMISNMTAYAIARHLRPHQLYVALLAQDGIELAEEREPPVVPPDPGRTSQDPARVSDPSKCFSERGSLT